MPPTGDYPPHPIKIKIKNPRISISSITKSPTFSRENRRQLQEADKRWKVKSILRILAALYSLIGFACYASAIPTWDADFYWGGGPNSGDWQDGFPVGVVRQYQSDLDLNLWKPTDTMGYCQLVFAFVYNVIMSYLILSHKITIHPLAPLIIDFHVWAALVPAITFSAGLGMFEFWTNEIETDGGPILWHVLHQIGSRELAGVVFACLVWVLTVVLWVLACIDTHKWRKARKAARNQPSTRGLEHADFVRSEQDGTIAPPPQYDHDAFNKDIELGPTSPTAREFV